MPDYYYYDIKIFYVNGAISQSKLSDFTRDLNWFCSIIIVIHSWQQGQSLNTENDPSFKISHSHIL